jgi:hypothetical protein
MFGEGPHRHLSILFQMTSGTSPFLAARTGRAAVLTELTPRLVPWRLTHDDCFGADRFPDNR